MQLKQAETGTAYLLWLLCLLGVCGGQRFYLGSAGTGVVYLLTFGFFGIGQILDLVLIPGMVERRNVYLRGMSVGVSQNVVVNIGDIPQLKQPQIEPQQKSNNENSMQKLLRAAKEHNGQLSLAQAAMHTTLGGEEVKQLLSEAVKAGYAEVTNDSETGAIRYRFDI